MFIQHIQKVISNNTQKAINRFLRYFNDIIYEFKTAVEILFEIHNPNESEETVAEASSLHIVGMVSGVNSWHHKKGCLRYKIFC